MSQTITYNGISSSTYDLTVYEQEGTFSSPRRDVEVVHVPGRNGDVLIDKGGYMNQKVRYNVIANDVTKIHGIANWLISATDYCELYDSWTYTLGTGNTEGFYREAIYSGDIDMAVTELNRRGQTTLEFDCKPQKYYTNTTAWPDFSSAGPGVLQIAVSTAPQVALPIIEITMEVDAGYNDDIFEIQLEQSTDGLNYDLCFYATITADSGDARDFDGAKLIIDSQNMTVTIEGASTDYSIAYNGGHIDFPQCAAGSYTYFRVDAASLLTDTTISSMAVHPRWWTI